MFKMSWKVTVGDYQLGMIETVEIMNSVELLSDTATITLPSAAFNRLFEINDKLRRGNAVKIELGYGDKPATEFEGYLSEEPQADNGSLVLKCEDGLFLYRKGLTTIELKKPRLSTILEQVHKDIKGFTVSCDYDFGYEKFVIRNMTGWDVLKKIQEETNANIYLKGTVLHIHAPYSEQFGEAKYDFSKNVDAEGLDLKWREAKDRKLMVKYSAQTADGKTITAQAGVEGGDTKSVKLPGVSDQASLQKAANEDLACKVYTGYEGTLTGWMVPYCNAGYKATLRDTDNDIRSGSYYVLSVKTTFGEGGGKRVVQLGKKL
jgi:hypothetical protein